MILDRQEAAAALNAVAQSRRRARELRDYAAGGSIVIGWGLAWFFANAVTQYDPVATRWAWPVAISGAVLWSVSRPRSGTSDWRVIASIGVAIAFIVITLALARADQRLANAIISMVVAAAYLVLGIWAGARFAVIGTVLAVAVLVGWFVAPAWLFGCLAVFGGGTLILGGWWLRQA